MNQGIGDTDIRAGMIGEIGVSPTFTEAEHNSLRAASLAQINNPHVAMNIHMPGWLRRGDEVLDIVLGEMGVSPNKVSLAHSDPSGKDVAYQRKMLDKGVWLEFDMIGLDITFPKEGIAPGVQETADAVAHLIELGYAISLFSATMSSLNKCGLKMAVMAGDLFQMFFWPIWRSAASIKHPQKTLYR